MFNWDGLEDAPTLVTTPKGLEEIDRAARAYGFEIGRGAKLTEMVNTSEDNPFLDPNWRNNLGKEENVYLTEAVIRQRFGIPSYEPDQAEAVSETLNKLYQEYLAFANRINEIVPDSNVRAKSLMLTELESSMHWAKKATENCY